MKTILPCIAALLAAVSPLPAQTKNQLQKALFAEEVEKDSAKAAAIYQKLIDQSADQPRNLAFARFRLAKLNAAAGRDAEALALLKALATDPNAPADWIAQASNWIAALERPVSRSNHEPSPGISERIEGKLWDWHETPDLHGDSYGTLRFLPDGNVETTCGVNWVTRWAPMGGNRFKIFQVEGKFWVHELSADGTDTTAIPGNGAVDATKRLSLHPVQDISMDDAEIGYIKEMLVNRPDAIIAWRMPGNLAAVSRTKALAFLFDHGISVDIREKASWRYTPLMFAAGSGTEATVKLLLDRDADPNLLDTRNAAPLFTAAGRGDAAIVSLMIDKGADLNNTSGWIYPEDQQHDLGTALHGAAYNGQMSVVRLLLDRGADIDAISPAKYQTALSQALDKSDFLMAKELLSRGANPNLPASGISNPLRKAATLGNLEMVRLLLEKGARPDIQSAESTEYSGLTRNVGGPLIAAARAGWLNAAQVLVEAGAPVDPDSPVYRETPIHAAALAGNTAMCRWLLEKGADPVHRLADDVGLQSGWTPLHSAAWRESLDVVNLLMENGASPATPAAELGLRRTPFQIAVLKGFDPVVKRMLEQAATPESRMRLLAQQDANGDTALHLAVSRDAKPNPDLVRFLIDAGAPMDIVNHRNQTPRQQCLDPETGSPDERIRALLGE
jgi:ankyrin repeat protein